MYNSDARLNLHVDMDPTAAPPSKKGEKMGGGLCFAVGNSLPPKFTRPLFTRQSLYKLSCVRRPCLISGNRPDCLVGAGSNHTKDVKNGSACTALSVN